LLQTLLHLRRLARDDAVAYFPEIRRLSQRLRLAEPRTMVADDPELSVGHFQIDIIQLAEYRDTNDSRRC
jgi:ribonuclease I